ncbi:MAG TPA: SgcJ/EcaC family oxidoreductase [Terriglobales bacterium]|nr:SgcJ/EcaC family oxidoreductase [Terriglobales bacterium]
MRTDRALSLVIAASLAVAMVAGCSEAPRPPMDTRKADEAAITGAGVALAQAAEAKDLDKCMSFYVDDPVLFVPGAPAVVGKDAVRQAFAGFLEVQALKLETSGLIIDVAQSGDLAFERGSYSNTITDAKGKTTTETGKLALVWKKQTDGSWKIAADTNASDR